MSENQFTYNDEFLPNPDVISVKNPEAARQDRENAQRAYPDIWFALQVDDFSKKFLDRDRKALALKDKFVIRGTWAIGLGVTALLVTFFQLLVVSILPIPTAFEDILRDFLPWVAFFLFATGIVASVRGGIGKRKRAWLGDRMFLERIRSWRWHYFVATIPDILDAIGDDSKKATYLAQRKAAFDEAWTSLSNGSHNAIKEMIDVSREPEREGTDRFNIKPHIRLSAIEDFKTKSRRIQNNDAFETAPKPYQRQIICAYRDLRMAHQHGYARYQVRYGVGTLRSHPGRQDYTFERLSNKLLIASIGLETVLILLTLRKSMISAEAPLPAWLIVTLAVAQFAIFAVVATAFGLKAMQHSLRTPVQVARLKGYRDEVKSIMQEYDTPNGPRLGNSIVSLERAAFNEMCEFIETGARSVFLL